MQAATCHAAVGLTRCGAPLRCPALPCARLHAVRTERRSGKPLMLFLHGFPESWFSWRHQMVSCADRSGACWQLLPRLYAPGLCVLSAM